MFCVCGKYASFGYLYDQRKRCCAFCKTDEMVDLVSKMCIICQVHYPSYGYPGGMRLCCRNCKNEEMINVINIVCEECGKCASYNDNNGRTYCCQCKTSNMMLFKKRNKCKCNRVEPVFGYMGDKRPTCCSVCKEVGMINMKTKGCICGKTPSYGYLKDRKRTCCARCKRKGMVDLTRINKKSKKYYLAF
jgi:hypothetical protein